MRDSKTEDILRHVGHGIKIKMDDAGNILIKRVSKNPVYVKVQAYIFKHILRLCS